MGRGGEAVKNGAAYAAASSSSSSFPPSPPPSPPPPSSVAPAAGLPPDAAARVLVDDLVSRGVDAFFGVCGKNAAPLFEAARLHPAARLIHTRHEACAVFAASLHARATGRPAAAVACGGPGILNCVAAVASASAEGDSVVVLSGDSADAAGGRVVTQDSGPAGCDAEGTLRPHTRAQLRASSANGMAGCAAAAVRAATDPSSPGPALLVVPLRVATARTSSRHGVSLPGPPAALPGPPPGDLERLARELLRARRPLLLLGADCRRCPPDVEALVAACRAPFATTPCARGLLPDDHPRSLGGCSLGRRGQLDGYAAGGAIDVAVAVGTRLDDAVAAARLDLSGAALHHAHADAALLGRNFPTAGAYACDAGAFCRGLREAVDEIRRRTEKGSQEEARRHEEAARAVEEAYQEAMGGPPYRFDVLNDPHLEPVKSCRAMLDIQEAMPPGTKYITDIGDHAFVASSFLKVTCPDSYFVSLRLGSMGSGIGGAIGLGVAADPGRYVVAIVGDGAMQMYGMEVFTALQHRLPIVFAVINDGGYNIVRHGMASVFGPGAGDDYASPRVDFALWARSLGVRAAASIKRGGEITKELLGGLMEQAGGGPVVLDIAVDPAFHMSGERLAFSS